MNRALQRDLRPLVPVFVVVLLVAFTLGYWTGGGRGAVTATGAMVLGMLVLSGLRLGFTHILDGSGVTWWSVITGAMPLFGVFVISQYGLLHRYSDAAVLLVPGGVVSGSVPVLAISVEKPSGRDSHMECLRVESADCSSFSSLPISPSVCNLHWT